MARVRPDVGGFLFSSVVGSVDLMKVGARYSAAMEILEDIDRRHRPVAQALADWGQSHRFAGSKDRSVIGNLVYDVLRQRASLAWRMNSDSPRSLVLGLSVFNWGESAENLIREFSDDKHAPGELSTAEFRVLSGSEVEVSSGFEKAPDWVRGNIPQWLEEHFYANFDDAAIEEAAALSERPPIDIRVNTHKSERPRILKALSRFNPVETSLSKVGIRLPATKGPARSANIKSEAGYQKGWFEIQDEGSQVASQLVYAKAGEQVLDYCAGAGGKTLALSAWMSNKGQIYAYDSDRNRLAPIYERIKRAGARNVQVRNPQDSMSDLAERMQRVVVDAPCTGSGIWRRRPDTKWRLTPEGLERRLSEQRQALVEASAFVRPGGLLCYITCSVIMAENESQIYAFCEDNPAFELISAGEVWEELYGIQTPKPWSSDGCSVTLTPASTGTDGFFFAVLERRY